MPFDTPLHDLTRDLRALGGGRVWSLMVSLFGDLAQGTGDAIEGPVLSAIMAALDVKPEAARVALHRLRNDGWITSTKAGRISHHSLSTEGRAKSSAASPRIYDTLSPQDKGWQLVMLDPADADAGDDMALRGFTQVQPNLYVGASQLQPPANAAIFAGNTAPAWLCAAAIPTALTPGYDKLADVLDALQTALPPLRDLSPLNIAVLRCLIVHNWRRLVLKHPAPPQGVVDAASGYGRCVVLVDHLLSTYPRPDLQDIAQD